jgi:hypothetical protein
MATQNVHITQINDTWANILAGLDDGQSAQMTDQTKAHVHRIGANRYWTAMSRYWNGSAFVYCDEVFNNITAKGMTVAGIVCNDASGNLTGGNVIGSGGIGAHALDSHSDWKPLDSVNIQGAMIACNSSGLWEKLMPQSSGMFLKLVGPPAHPAWAAHGLTYSDVGALAVGGTAADSDKLDGQHGAYYAPAAHGVTVGTIPKAASSTSWANSQIIENATGIGFGVSPSYFVHASKDQDNATSLTISNVNNHVSAYSAITALSNSINQITLVANSTLCTEYSNHCGGLASTGKSLIYLRNITGAVIDNHSNTPLYLATNNVVRETITAAGLVGIGALGMDIDTLLHVAESNAGTVTSAANTLLSIERNGDAWISILTPAANAGGIYFGSPTSSQRGVIRYDHSTDVLSLCIGSTAETIGIHAGGIYMGDTLYAGFGNSYASPDLKIYSDGLKAKFDCGSWAEFSNRLYCETNKRVACGGGQSGAYTTPIGTVTLQIDNSLYTLPYTSVTTI